MAPSKNLIPNRFATATRNNPVKAGTIGNDVEATLAEKAAADLPTYGTMYNTYKTANHIYQQLLASHAYSIGQKEGASQTLAEMIDEMRAKGRLWKRGIDAVYNEGTPEYKAIFPDGITPFSTGKQTDMLTYTHGVSLALVGLPLVSSVKSDVDAELAKFTGINLGQKGKVSATKAASDELEAGRKNLCDSLLLVQGQLIVLFYKMPEVIDAFFPMELINHAAQTVYTDNIAAGEVVHFVVKRTLAGTVGVDMTNNGSSELWFYWAASRTAAFDPATATKVMPGETISKTAAEMGASAVNCFLLAHNADGLNAGHYTVDI